MKTKNNLNVSGLILTGIALAILAVFAACDPDGSFANPFFDFSPPPHEHVWGEWATLREATCAAKGEAKRVCTEDASHVEARALPIIPDAHKWELREGEGSIRPTCVEPGWGIQVCLNCEKIELENEIAPLGHEFEDYEFATAPTCSALGVETAHCARFTSGCDATDDQFIDIDPDAHEWGEDFTVLAAATCSADGVMEGACVYNPEHVSSSIPIPLDPDAHDYPSAYTEVTPATCIRDGEEKRTCAHNGAHVDPRPIPLNPDAHRWPLGYELIAAATCMADGEERRICALSPAHVETLTIDLIPDAHSYDTYLITTPERAVPGTYAATCTEEGMERGTCALNRSHTPHLRPVPVNPSAHSWGEWSEGGTRGRTGTCTEMGVKVRTCAFNPTAHVDEDETPINEDAHNWNNVYKVTTAPTCTAAGEETDTCRNAAAHTRPRAIDIDLNAHNYSYAVATVATCTAAGASNGTCSYNKEHTTTRTDIALGHNWHNAYVVTTPAKCEAVGVSTDTCARDKTHTREQPIAALGHSWNNNYTITTPPNCMQPGNSTDTCARDKTHTRDKSVDPDPDAHIYEYVTVPATCIAAGSRNGTCFGNTEHPRDDNILPIDLVNGHVYDDSRYPWSTRNYATCVAAGEESRRCTLNTRSDAHAETRTIPIDPTHHSYFMFAWDQPLEYDQVWITNRAPTCTAAGRKVGACSYDSSHPRGDISYPIDPDAHTIHWVFEDGGYAYGDESWYRARYKNVIFPTCSYTGQDVSICSSNEAHLGYDTVRPIPIDPDNHRYSATWRALTDATCMEAGTEVKTCDYAYSTNGEIDRSRWHYVESRPYTDPDAHDWKFKSGTIPQPTCMSSADQPYDCRNNPSHTKTVTVPLNPDAHLYINSTTTNPTCEVDGFTKKVCWYNPAHLSDIVDTIAALGHDYQWAYTCTETADGTRQKKCTHDQSHTSGASEIAYATGTAGLAYTYQEYYGWVFLVQQGTATGSAHIPAYHLNATDDKYYPVRMLVNQTLRPNFDAGNMSSITVAANSQYHASEDGIVYNKEKTAIFLVPPKISGARTLATTLVSLREGEFKGCAGLTGVTMSEHITSIPKSAFEGCSGLASVRIRTNVTAVGESAFQGCSNLADVVFAASNVASIGKSAFEGCGRLASITLPDSVAAIGERAFYGCSGLTTIRIPPLVTDIAYWDNFDGVFTGCSQLATVTVSSTNTVYAAEGGIVYNKTKTALYFAPLAIKGDVVLATTLFTIPLGAFQNRSKMVKITIGPFVTSFGVSSEVDFGINSFDGCTDLTEINVNAANATYASSYGILYNKSYRNLIRVPEGYPTFGHSMLQSNYLNQRQNSLLFPNTMERIYPGAFKNCRFIETVTFDVRGYNNNNPGHSVQITGDAFSGCDNLRKISVTPDNGYTTNSVWWSSSAPPSFPGNLNAQAETADSRYSLREGTYTRPRTTTWEKTALDPVQSSGNVTDRYSYSP